MKPTHILFLIGFLFILPEPIYSQEDQFTSVEVLGSQGVFESAFMIRPEGRYRTIKGSPYLDDGWYQGTVWLDGDTASAHFPMRYNVYGNEMQFIYGLDTFAIANPLSVEKLLLGDREFEYLSFMNNSNENLGYFEVLIEGDTRLLALHQVKLIAGKEPVTPYHAQNEYDRFVARTQYYLQLSDNPEPIITSDKKSDWIKLSGENQDILKSFIKDERIKFKKEIDLKKLVRFLNNLENTHEEGD